MHRRITGALVAAVAFWGAAQASASDLALGRGSAVSGGSVTVPIVYRQRRGPVAVAVDTDITFDPRVLSNPRCAAGENLVTTGPAAKMVICGTPQAGVVRIAVLGLNAAAIESGEVAMVTFDVASSARRRLYALRHKPGAADAQGRDFSLTHRNGTIRVR